jgi:opacity protein-like surface antigen
VKARIAICAATAVLAGAAPASADAPPNDAFANAQVLPTPASVPGTTVDATREPGEPNYDDQYGIYGQGTVWYSWTAPKTSRYRVADCGVANDSAIFVFTGASLDQLTRAPSGSVHRFDPPLDCGPDDRHGASEVFNATAGVTYRIVVLDAFIGDNQPFQLTVDEPPVPIYDSAIKEKASKKSVKKGGTVTYTTTLTNTGTVTIDQEWVELIASKPGSLGSSARHVKYVSIKSTRGTCHKQTYFSKHKGAMCAVGRLDPGQSAVVTAKVKVSQAITHWAFLDYQPGSGDPVPDDRPGNDEAKVLTKLKK